MLHFRGGLSSSIRGIMELIYPLTSIYTAALLEIPSIHVFYRFTRNLYPFPNQVLCPKTILDIMYIDPIIPMSVKPLQPLLECYTYRRNLPKERRSMGRA